MPMGHMMPPIRPQGQGLGPAPSLQKLCQKKNSKILLDLLAKACYLKAMQKGPQWAAMQNP